MFSCFYWRQHVNIHRTGWQKVVEPSDLITGRPSLGNNNLNQTFPVVADQTCTTGRRNFGAFLFTKLFQFSKILGVSRVNCSLNVMPQNLNGLRSGLWLGHSKTQIIFLLKPFCCWFTSCFGSLSCCIIHPQLNFTWWWDDLKSPIKCLYKPGSFYINDSTLWLPKTWCTPHHRTSWLELGFDAGVLSLFFFHT